VFLLSLIAAAYGADDPNDYQESPVVRTSYTDENAPPGVRLMLFLTWFAAEDIDHDIVMKSKLQDGEFRAEEYDLLLVYFEDLRNRIESEIDREMWQIACHERADRLDAVEVRAVWNALEDLRHGTYAKHVAIASGELAALGYVDFPEKLEIMETGFGSTGYDYRDTQLISDQQILEARPEICEGLRSRMSSVLD
jgi:hypothetical protein